jgi:hypothetical protein
VHGSPPARAADTECNPYYPLSAKARWVFLDSTNEASVKLRRTVTVESVKTADGVTTAEVNQTVSGGGDSGQSVGSATTTVSCTGGAIELVVKGLAGEAGPSNAAGSVTAKLAGLPPADKLVAGYSWRSEGLITTNQEGSVITTRVVRGSRVDGTFSVSVPAGQFAKALRILSVQTMTLRLADGDHQSTQQIVEWYVRGLGLAKRETRIGSSNSDPVASAEELAEFSGLTPTP